MYIPDLTERYPEGFDGVDMLEPRNQEYEMWSAMEKDHDDSYKANYLEARNASGEKNFSFKMLQALRDMAKENVYPDGRFSDEECNVWEMFKSMKW